MTTLGALSVGLLLLVLIVAVAVALLAWWQRRSRPAPGQPRTVADLVRMREEAAARATVADRSGSEVSTQARPAVGSASEPASAESEELASSLEAGSNAATGSAPTTDAAPRTDAATTDAADAAATDGAATAEDAAPGSAPAPVEEHGSAEVAGSAREGREQAWAPGQPTTDDTPWARAARMADQWSPPRSTRPSGGRPNGRRATGAPRSGPIPRDRDDVAATPPPALSLLYPPERAAVRPWAVAPTPAPAASSQAAAGSTVVAAAAAAAASHAPAAPQAATAGPPAVDVPVAADTATEPSTADTQAHAAEPPGAAVWRVGVEPPAAATPQAGAVGSAADTAEAPDPLRATPVADAAVATPQPAAVEPSAVDAGPAAAPQAPDESGSAQPPAAPADPEGPATTFDARGPAPVERDGAARPLITEPPTNGHVVDPHVPTPARVAGRIRRSPSATAAEQAAADLALLRTFGVVHRAPADETEVELEGCAAAADEPASGAAQPVVFQVVGRDGRGVPHASVTLLDDHGRETAGTVADADGRGELTARHPGSYMVVTAADGYQPGAITLPVGEGPVDTEIPLTRSASVAGAVSGEDGPVVGAQLVLVQDGEIVAAVESAADGAYRFADLAAGEYGLSVSAQECEPAAIVLRVADEEDLRQDVDLDPAGLPADHPNVMIGHHT